MNARRLLLVRTVKVLALLGLGFAVYPFVAGLLPGDGVGQTDGGRPFGHWARVIDLAGLPPGQLLRVDGWPGGPVAIYRRGDHELAGLARVENELYDPQSQESRQPDALRTRTRAHLETVFVFLPTDTDRGCQVRSLPANKQPRPGIAWYGGFTEPCTGSLYDTAGRLYRGPRTARQQNLAVPHYRVLDDQRIELLGPPPGS
ncbi:MAG: hypothetical protein K8I04_12875 [Gammaproteobacteria bacterium]|nr:hypothetical protein [Gammaproteobacteria bacterium]